MYAFFSLAGLGSVIAFFGGLVWLIVALIRLRSVRNPSVTVLAGVVVFIIVIIAQASLGSDDASNESSPASSSAAQTDAPSVASSPPTQAPPTPTSIPSGESRSEPAPYGYPVVHSGIEVTVLDVTRGIDLPDIFTPLDEGNEWVVVNLRLRNQGDPDKTKRYHTSDFRIVGSRGIIYDDWFITPNTGSNLGSGEFFGGGEVEGNIVQQVHQDDADLTLIYAPAFRGSRYLSIEKP